MLVEQDIEDLYLDASLGEQRTNYKTIFEKFVRDVNFLNNTSSTKEQRHTKKKQVLALLSTNIECDCAVRIKDAIQKKKYVDVDSIIKNTTVKNLVEAIKKLD